MKNNKYIIVVGCGRFGAHVSGRLSSYGHSIVVIDTSSYAFNRLPAEFSGFCIEGDATEIAVLKQAKIHQADMLIAATRKDNINLMTAQFASVLFNVNPVFARVYDLKREDLYRSMGIKTICPTLTAVDSFMDEVKKSNFINVEEIQ